MDTSNKLFNSTDTRRPQSNHDGLAFLSGSRISDWRVSDWLKGPRLFLAILFSFCLQPVSAFAETSIGFVDIPYLIEQAPQALDAELRLEAEFAPRQLNLREQREELEASRAKLEEQSLDMSESERGLLERQVRGLERRLKRDEMDFREELNIQKNAEFKKVRVIVLDAIAKFGKENNYDLIVSDGVLYAAKTIDVTEKILEYLVKSNRALQSSN